MTQENVSHCGSTTTGKPIVGLRPGLTLKQTKHVRRASRPRGTTHRVRKSKTYRKKNCIKRM